LYAKETEFSMYVLCSHREETRKERKFSNQSTERKRERAGEEQPADEQLAWLGSVVGEEPLVRRRRGESEVARVVHVYETGCIRPAMALKASLGCSSASPATNQSRR
jgi:hypothetical protein